MWNRHGTVEIGFSDLVMGLILNGADQERLFGFGNATVNRDKRYEPIWLLMNKIRISIANWDKKYSLDGYIEMDEGFFEGHRKKPQPEQSEVQTKELDRQVKAVVGVSTQRVKQDKKKKYKPDTQPLYLKRELVDALTNEDMNWAATNMVSSDAVVHTDGRRCYNVLKGIWLTNMRRK